MFAERYELELGSEAGSGLAAGKRGGRLGQYPLACFERRSGNVGGQPDNGCGIWVEQNL